MACVHPAQGRFCLVRDKLRYTSPLDASNRQQQRTRSHELNRHLGSLQVHREHSG